jgi:hypothetical protein
MLKYSDNLKQPYGSNLCPTPTKTDKNRDRNSFIKKIKKQR